MTRPEMVRKLMVSVRYVSDVESGKRRPSQEYICRVTGILGLSSKEVRLAIEEDDLNGLPSTENVLPFQRL
jgi:transcriptional regulator with XRE-family HTH domain